MDKKQEHKLKAFIKNLDGVKGRHTELVTIYIPAGYDLNKIINHIKEEQGTASNIKDKTTRNSVIDALERVIRHLRLFKKTPDNGLAVFSGNFAEREGQQDIRIFSIEPPEPLNYRLYRCDQIFVLDALKAMLETHDIYGLLVLDNREADVGLLKGTAITSLTHMTSGVPGKTRAGGQCLVPDTLIQNYTGDLVNISEVKTNPHILKSIDFKKNSLIDSKVLDKWENRKEEVYRITTKYPRLQIECSKDHVFFVTGNKIEEKSAEELKIGDFLIMPEKIEIRGQIQTLNSYNLYNSFIITNKGRYLIKTKREERSLYQKKLAKELGVTQTAVSVLELGKRNIRTNLLKKLCNLLDLNFETFVRNHCNKNSGISLPNELNSEFAQILGYYTGDGDSEKERLSFSEENKEVAYYYKNKISKFFNANSSIKFREGKGYWMIRIYGKPIVSLIEREFQELKKALDSAIPKKILESPNEIVASYLRGLFDAEGYVAKTRGLGISMNNKKLIQQVQLLLLRFRIITSFNEYDNKRNKYSDNPRFSLDVTERESLRLFKEFIDFSSDIKRKDLDKILTKSSSERSTVRQIIVSGKEIRKIIENAGYNLELFPKVNNFFRNERMMSKQAFKNSILSYVKDKNLYNKLEEIYNIPILPVRIKSIERINKTVSMFDVSVKNQNFIANALIVHNSSVRFARLREIAAHDFYKRIAEIVNKEFINPEIKGIIIGGPGFTKNTFYDGNYLSENIKKKVLALKDLSYTGEFGLNELVDKSNDTLAQLPIIKEKKLINDFFEMIAKNSDKAVYGLAKVKYALELGAVNILLISDNLEDSLIEELEELAGKTSSTVEMISIDTKEGNQFKELGGVAAILRFPIK